MQGPPDLPPDLPPPPSLRPRSVADILETAFSLYRRHWVTLVKLVAILIVPLTLLQYLLGDLFQDEVVVDASGRMTIDEGFASGFIGGTLLVVFASAFIGLLLTGAIAWAVATILIGREPDLSDSYRNGYKRIWSILLVSVLSALAVGVGFILLIIPGLIVLTRLSAAIPAVVIEQRKGTDALGRSWNLVKGYGWPVFGALVVSWLIAGIVNGIITSLGGDNWFVGGIVASIGAIITMPFTALVVGLIYFDLRVRKENLDLATLEREVQAAAAS